MLQAVSGALQDQQAGGVARLDRGLRDAFGGKMIIEIGGLHGKETLRARV